jgi:hypothetical protein
VRRNLFACRADCALSFLTNAWNMPSFASNEADIVAAYNVMKIASAQIREISAVLNARGD